MRKVLVLGALVALIGVLAGCKAVVTPQQPVGWFFLNEGANGTGVYVNGPATPPAGRGSALLTVDANGREDIATGAYSGTALSSITALRYSTYQAFTGSPSETPVLQFDVDYDSTDASTAYQGRLVFVPGALGVSAVQPNVWQDWDTMTAGAGWYSSASDGSTYRPIVSGNQQLNPPCTQASYCTWSQIQNDYPNARIRPTVNGSPGLLLVRAGGPVTGGLVAATDNVVIGIGGNTIENNFEPGDGNVVVNTAKAASLGFGFVNETSNGSGSFVSGPNGSDGAGSAQLTVDATGGEALATGIYAGTRFDQLQFLSYKTYSKTPNNHATTLQFDTDYDANDANTSFQGRVVFEPSVSGQAPITGETWQTWNPMTAPSGWWQTASPTHPPIVGGNAVPVACTQAVPCSFVQFKAAYPDAAIRGITGAQTNGQPVGGGIWLKAGGGWSGGYTGNVDSLTVAVQNANNVNGTATYDFEP